MQSRAHRGGHLRFRHQQGLARWIPAFAGMTIFAVGASSIVIPAKAGIQLDCLNHKAVIGSLECHSELCYDEG
jgi:hypothetical protein